MDTTGIHILQECIYINQRAIRHDLISLRFLKHKGEKKIFKYFFSNKTTTLKESQKVV
jgi:hypothetical protein